MKNFKAIMLISAGLIFNNCLGMENPSLNNQISSISIQTDPVTKILSYLHIIQEADSHETLTANDFWKIMDLSTGMGSVFLGQLWYVARQEQAACILKNLIKFGNEDKTTFFKCMNTCFGADYVTPLHGIISIINAQDTTLFVYFKELLNLISTFENKSALLTQRSAYTGTLIEYAQFIHKPFIVDAINAALTSK